MVSITYVLVVPDLDDVTLLQGWSRGAVSSEFLQLVAAAIVAPFDTAEIFLSQEDLIRFRSRGARKKCITIGHHLVRHVPSLIESEFVILLVPLSSASEALELDFPQGVSSVVVTTGSVKGALNISALKGSSPHMMFDYCIFKAVRTNWRRSGVKAKLPKLRQQYSNVADFTFYGSGCTVANEFVMLSLGFRSSPSKYIVPLDIQFYYDAISEGVESLLCISDKYRDVADEAVLYAPAIKGFFYNVNSHFWNQVIRGIKRPAHRDFIKNGMIKNPGYSGYSIVGEVDPSDHPYSDPTTAYIVQERQRELKASNYAIALLASNETIPAIRLPNSVNLHLAKLKEIEYTQKRGDDKSRRHLQVKFRALSDEFSSAFGDRLKAIAVNKIHSFKICSDAPLEWTYLGNLPLMISHQVSKIPMTPGNMLLQLSATNLSDVDVAQLRNILVIRSFSNNDKIKNYLELGVGCFPLKNGTSIKFIDVVTIDEVVKALNEFSGALVVFDCHGDHDPDGAGWLQIGSEKMISWDLHSKARVPPIVMLSACSTSAIGGSHASVSSGFIRCGALSVIGTFLPVDAVGSSAFMSRIIFRIDSFLSLLKNAGYESVDWRTFISYFLRMSYATDVLKYFLNDEKAISIESYREIHFNVNCMINAFDDAWYDSLIAQVSDVSGISVSDLFEKIKVDNPLMETMFYCQLGRPELISIKL